MKRNDALLWALAAGAGILYLATRAASSAANLAPGTPAPAPNTTSATDPLTPQGGAPATFAPQEPNTAQVNIQRVYDQDIAATDRYLDDRRESGRFLELDMPAL